MELIDNQVPADTFEYRLSRPEKDRAYWNGYEPISIIRKALYYIGQNISHGIRIHPPLNSLILLKIAQSNQVSFSVKFPKPIALRLLERGCRKGKIKQSLKFLMLMKRGQNKCLTKHLCNWFKLKHPNRGTVANTRGFVLESQLWRQTLSSDFLNKMTVKRKGVGRYLTKFPPSSSLLWMPF